MQNGKVKWYNAGKGYGFIQPDDGGTDVFIHVSALESLGITTLAEGQLVSFDLASRNGKTSAANLRLIEAS